MKEELLHQAWMHRAMALAKYAGSIGEVPVGAVAVLGNCVIGEGYNSPIRDSDPTAHAEMKALKMAARVQQNYRLPGLRLYVTLEPCAMCATAMVHARIDSLIYAAHDLKTGAAGSVLQILDNPSFNHRVSIFSGLLEQQASQMLSQFFQNRRKLKKQKKLSEVKR